MIDVKLVLTLSDDLVREAEEEGLLTADAIEEMIQLAVRRRRTEKSKPVHELVDESLHVGTFQQTSRVLRAAGLVTDLSPSLQQKADAAVNLEAVQAALARSGSPPLSQLVIEQRGQKE